MKIIDKIKSKAADAAICGDVIVGFPGETDEAFEKTLEIMRRVKFDNLNSFAYSPRPNTEAALFEDQVPEQVKSDRLLRVQALAQEHGLERSERYLNKVVEVLVEEANPRNPDQVFGRTRQGRQVFFDGSLEALEGKLVNVVVTGASTWSLTGQMVL
jgi:tRNA-2-methylthio-N6-dimethylallyladenosine synthase